MNRLISKSLNAGVALVIFACLASTTGCKKKTETTSSRPSASPYVVEVVSIKTRPFRSTLFATGSLRAREAVNLQAERAGIITAIHFEEGKPVKAGDILVTIDDSELQAELKRAEAELELAVAVEKRDRALSQDGNIVSQAEYERSQANLHIARAEVELVKAQIAKTKIKAPFDAVAGLRHVSKGAYVTPGTAIASLQDISSLKIDFTVPERYLAQLRKAQSVTFRVAGSGETVTAKIDAIEPAVNVATRSLTVRAVAPNETRRLLPGSFAEVEVLLEEIPNAILIPAIALIPGLKEQRVFLYNNGQVQERVVQVGMRTADAVEIEEGLKPADQLIVSGILQLRPGMKVNVKQVPDEISNQTNALSAVERDQPQPSTGTTGNDHKDSGR